MKYIELRRSDTGGAYTNTVQEIAGNVEAELDDIKWLKPGTFLTLTVVEMSEEEYAALPEFEGW